MLAHLHHANGKATNKMPNGLKGYDYTLLFAPSNLAILCSIHGSSIAILVFRQFLLSFHRQE
jgi:hypothetical protein